MGKRKKWKKCEEDSLVEIVKHGEVGELYKVLVKRKNNRRIKNDE